MAPSCQTFPDLAACPELFLMVVRLTVKLADKVNGVDLSQYREGDVIELAVRDASMLIAEKWAEPVDSETEMRFRREDHSNTRDIAADRGRSRRDQ